MAQNVDRAEVSTGFWNIPDKLLILYAHKCFGWKKVGANTKVEYSASDDGKTKKHRRTIYYYARPSDYPRSIFFRICEGLNDFARIVRGIGLLGIVLGFMLMLFFSRLFEDFIMNLLTYSAIAFFSCVGLNLLLPILGALSSGLAPSILSETQKKAMKQAVKQEGSHLKQQSKQEQAAAQAKSVQMKAESLEREAEKQRQSYEEHQRWLDRDDPRMPNPSRGTVIEMRDAAAEKLAELEAEAEALNKN